MHAVPVRICKKSFDTLCLACLWSLVGVVLGFFDGGSHVQEQTPEVAKVGLT
jgi:hypothetical protein